MEILMKHYLFAQIQKKNSLNQLKKNGNRFIKIQMEF